jgi:CrcB protein
MNLTAAVAVFVGAGSGALLRWVLNLALNPLWSTLPLGTVAANLGGGLLAGAAAQWFELRAGLPPELRLLLITGFLGGLTTFSAFSLELMALLQQGRHAWLLGSVLLHVAGSLLCALLGAALLRGLLSA